MKSIVLVLATLSACSLGDSSQSMVHRYVSLEQGYSTHQPQGWSLTIVRGFAQFAPSPTDAQHRKHTIVVRSATKQLEMTEGKSTSKDDVLAATTRVVSSLPKAIINERSAIEGGELSGLRFSFSFMPTGQSRSYRREHVVLVGSKRVFHIMYTAPAGEPLDEVAFRSVVTSFAEEG